MVISLRTTLHFWLRALMYKTCAASVVQRTRHLIGLGPAEHETSAYWNEQIHRLYRCPNLNGRVSGELRYTTTALLLRSCASRSDTVLDLGCAYGDLADALLANGLRRYVGVDLSDLGIDAARQRVATQLAERSISFEFHQSDLRQFSPDDTDCFDVIVFNEVLKYFDVEDAVRLVERYTQWLAPDGVVFINLSADPKCEAIFRGLEKRFRWVYGTVYQQRPDRPLYRLTPDRANPAYLAGVLRP